MRKALLLIVLLAGLASCTGREIKVRLADIESYINERPDSALSAIRDIDTTALFGRAVKAKYSLLHAMALDKNYIDTADTRIVQPAVEYYSRHGTPDQKLKSYYYEGISFYNGGQYNKAIISFTKGQEYIREAKDKKLCGMLYSCLADTYTKTWDYSQAAACIDKAIEYFRFCDRGDFVNIEKYRKAQNLVNRKEWEQAFANFKELLADSTFSPSQKRRIESSYAMAILTSPWPDDSLALSLFTCALEKGGTLEGVNQYGAYSYVLYSDGQIYKADSVLNQVLYADGPNGLYYNYWKHRIQLKDRDYKGAYHSLWEAMVRSDSLSKANQSISALNAQRSYLEKLSLEKTLSLQKKETLIGSLVFFFIIIALIMLFFFWKNKNKTLEEKNIMASVVDSLERQILVLKKDNDERGALISRLEVSNNRAKYSYLSELYEILYLSGKNDDEESLNKMYKRLKSKVKTLLANPSSKDNFENLLNKDSNQIMIRFRKDYPDFSDLDFRIASYIFAGFDNTTLMLLLDTTPSNARVLKSRLKAKIEKSSAVNKMEYLAYFCP